jgi:hypothetical protein
LLTDPDFELALFVLGERQVVDDEGPPDVCTAEVFRVASSCRLGRRLGRIVDDVTDTTYHCFARGSIMARPADGGVEIWIPRGTVMHPEDR